MELLHGDKVHVNESMITREARPLAKKKGDVVIGGTLNENGVLHVQTTRVGSESVHPQLFDLWNLWNRPDCQSSIQICSPYFQVITLSLSTWLALVYGRLPMPLGPQLPPQLWLVIGVGASQGVLIKGGQALESAHK
ncbi:hypothetical protein IFM89_039167, partial [Coptis chinensis]